jgi:hypothetical protein
VAGGELAAMAGEQPDHRRPGMQVGRAIEARGEIPPARAERRERGLVPNAVLNGGKERLGRRIFLPVPELKKINFVSGGYA